ncbi:hypothetical protein ACHQM5_023651 [Ranunculus cassubicifolius]
MSLNEDHDDHLHIVMFPWLAFGHILPYLELSKYLAEKGNKISLVSTPRNIQRLPKVPSNLASLLTLVEIPFPQPTENLPDGAEATSDLPIEKVEYLKKAFDGLESPFAKFLESSSPDWVVVDFMHHWVPPMAAKLNIPSAFYSTFNASFLSFMGPPSVYIGGEYEGERAVPEKYISPAKWIPFDNNLHFTMYEIMRMTSSVNVNGTGVSDAARFGLTVQGANIVAIRSSMELESEWLNLLQETVYRKPVFPIGLLMPRVNQREDENNEKWVQIKEWLDHKETKSVVYIAFGSEAILSQEETTELALGLESSELPFFWVWRTPVGSAESELPPGFEDRVKGRGYICRTWAPQLKILSHDSVGGFLTHSGWNSVIESLGFGCPLVLLPLINDQAIMARMLVWKKIGFEVPRSESDGSFTRKSVAESLRRLMVEDEGEVYRRKAKELKGVVGDTARQDEYVSCFESYLKQYKLKRT